jgi:ribose transport system ATP-binding protein
MTSTAPAVAPTDGGTTHSRLRMRQVFKQFGATAALSGVDLDVQPGQVLALVGENGAGKSTLMKILSGAHQPDAGEMWLDGKPYQPTSPLDARRAGVAMIYQELAQAPDLSVAENILLGAEPHFGPLLNWKKLRTIARDAVAQVGLAGLDVDQPISRLSVAQRQLVEIARAVAVGCRVLVLDEPTSSLTATDIQALFTLVRRLKSDGHAIVYISHFLEEVRQIADRFTVLRDGRSVAEGFVADVTNEQIVTHMVGRTVTDLYPRSTRTPGEVLLTLNNLSGKNKPIAANLQLRRGEVVGIAGLVGAGRTELLRTIFNLDPVTAGSVTVSSFAAGTTPAQRWSQRVGLVSEDRKLEGLALQLSIADNMTLASHSAFVSPAQMRRDSTTWISKLSVKCRNPSQNVGDLSGGNQQKVAIARLLHHDVDVLLLDEPTRGIDIGAKAQIYKLIDELACAGKAVLMVSSYLPELLGTCDRIAVMCKGSLSPALPVAQWDEHRIMLAALAPGSAPGNTPSAASPTS